jgi:hypothetical protein
VNEFEEWELEEWSSTQMMPQQGRKYEHHIGARIRNADRPDR